MKTKYDQEILSYIKESELSSVIKIHEQTAEMISKIENNFVMGYGGIAWESNKIIYSQKLPSDSYKNQEYARKFIDIVIDAFPHLLDENVYIIGDSLTNLGYEIKCRTFLKISDIFLSIPQHTYIWFENSKKCINFTFEGEVYFG